jgi:hypothetical protein
MSRNSKKLYKKYLATTKNTSPTVVSRFLKRIESTTTVKEIADHEIIKNLKHEYEFYYNLLMVSLNKNQVDLLLEIYEIIEQLEAVYKDMIYREGFKDGFITKCITSRKIKKSQ